MSWTTLVAHPASVVRAKFWKLFMKGKHVFFLSFGSFYQNVTSWGYIFSPLGTYPVNSVEARMYKMYKYLMKHFSLFATVAMIPESVFFPFPQQPLLRKHIPSTLIYTVINQNYSWKEKARKIVPKLHLLPGCLRPRP